MTHLDSQSSRYTLDSFLCPRSRYYGPFSPQALAFNANLQEFAHRVSYISGLQTGGKLAFEEAYEKIQSLYEQLIQSKETLNL